MLQKSRQGLMAGAASTWSYQSAAAFRATIIATLGNAPIDIEPGRLYRFPTNGRPSDSAGWCRLFEGCRSGVYGDWRAGITEVWVAADREILGPAERVRAVREALAARAARHSKQLEQWSVNRHYLTGLLSSSQPLQAGDPVHRYLQRRGFESLEGLPACLRFHRSLAYGYPDGRVSRHPAMLAPLIAPDGRTVALHRTYLTQDGRKADVPTVKKVTRTAGSLNGAMIPLFAPDRGRLGVAEGIETALAARCASGLPVVAAYSAGALASWVWPAELKRLVIFADHDSAGIKAAETLQARARRARLSCEILMPSQPGQDWADVWAESFVDRQEAWSAA